MPAETELDINERRKCLRRMKDQYEHASRPERTRLLNYLQELTGLHRKSLIRLLNGSLERKPRQRQRGRGYGPQTEAALLLIAESLDYPCAKRLTPKLLDMAQHLATCGEIVLSPSLLADLQQISISTVGRILKRSGQKAPRRLPRRSPRPPNPWLREVPVQRIPWDEPEPGHFEVDLVQHSGPDSSGDYVHTLSMVDIASGWVEQRALLGRSFLVMQDAFQVLLARLPFPIRELHTDNGPEFFNHHLHRFWQQTNSTLRFSRSRPYQKNDNRFVEQRNYSQVRAYLGHGRFDTVAQTLLLNQLYDKMWLYHNLFQPVMRLIEKEVIPREGRSNHIRRRHDQAQTPFERVCASKALPAEEKERLERLRAATNPRHLRQEIYALIDRLLALPCALPGQVQDVYLTLTPSLNLKKGEGIPVTFSFDTTMPTQPDLALP